MFSDGLFSEYLILLRLIYFHIFSSAQNPHA